jgi:hypothetical protein
MKKVLFVIAALLFATGAHAVEMPRLPFFVKDV